MWTLEFGRHGSNPTLPPKSQVHILCLVSHLLSSNFSCKVMATALASLIISQCLSQGFSETRDARTTVGIYVIHTYVHILIVTLTTGI